jgi:hypothetical protein
MGYDIHITRADMWFNSEASPIPLEEWLAVIASDPELKLDNQNGPHDFLWFPPDGQTPYPLWWAEGRIHTKNPERAMVEKMLEVAARLGARVQGDHGEVYPSIDHWPDRGVHE